VSSLFGIWGSVNCPLPDRRGPGERASSPGGSPRLHGAKRRKLGDGLARVGAAPPKSSIYGRACSKKVRSSSRYSTSTHLILSATTSRISVPFTGLKTTFLCCGP
jgi:hypothetical protein